MPALSRMVHGVNRRMFTEMEGEPTPAPALPAPPNPIGPGIFTICPLPMVVAYPDALRQFYREGIPQTRVLPPA